ncbi:Integrase catalytic domain-containing protein, partial [Durusdinium trenchii]
MPTPFSAAGLCQQLDATALPPTSPVVSSAFEMLGKPAHAAATVPVDPQETMLKALTAALSGDRKSLPTWSGDVATLRSWLRQLTLWEMDNNLPRHKWGLKLLQAFGDQTPPRRIAEAVDLATLTSENGYAAILTAIMAKYGPYLEAAGPAAIEAFFYGTERNKNENLSSYVATKEIALQELESNLGEKLPPRIAGRILLRHANLSDAQREAMAVKYNALLTFEQAAAALRPLDRPDALVQKVTKNFAAASTYVGAAEAEDDEEELIEDNDGHEESEGPESDGQGNLTYLLFDPQEEYTEEEATYIWAYNSAYKDVRRELQARRKGRQFFKKGSGMPVQKKGKTKGAFKKGKGKGSSIGKGRGRGTPDDLMSRTKCFSCGGLGHMSRDCPHQDAPQNFFVCHGTGREQTRIYAVNVNPTVQKQLEIFAGVRTESFEAVVDTAAEEAVIGSNAMQRLRLALAQHGLQPMEAPGTTATCAGIGGSATIRGVFDVPVGIAKTNGLLRVTEVADAGSFETPFLLPISYIELVGGIIDTGRNLFALKGGRKTPMRRLPSGHRTISVLEFAGRWKLPESLAQELTMTSGANPFFLPKAQGGDRLQQRPGVAVWLKRGADLVFMGSMPGRNTLVHPDEILPTALKPSLSRSRTTCKHMFMKFFLTEQLSLLARKQFPLALQAFRCRQPSQLPFLQSWLVVQANRLDLFSSMQSRIAGWLYKSDQESQQAPRRRNSKKLEAAWARMVQMTVRMLISVICQSAMDHLMNRNKYPAVASTQVTEKETKSKKTKGDGRIRRGIGRPLKHSTACATWRYTPSECQHDDDKLRQRGSKDQFWWTCLDCGSRWERVEWQADEEINRRSGARSSTENPATPTPIEIMTHSDNPYPQKLPPPKSRPELATLIVKDIAVPSGVGGGTTSGKDDKRQAPIRVLISERRAASSHELGSAADAESHQASHRPCVRAGRTVRDPLFGKQRGEHSGRLPMNETEEGKGYTCTTSTTMKTLASPTTPCPLPSSQGMARCSKSPLTSRSKSSMAAMLMTVSVLCMVPEASARIAWLGSRMESGDPSGQTSTNSPMPFGTSTPATFAVFPVNASLKELARSDFDGAPKTLERSERQSILAQITKYLDHVGEVYSPPRVSKEARRQGLRASIALDLTTGWDFRDPAQRQKARELVRKHRPAVLLLSPPCTTFSPLRRLSNYKRPSWLVKEEEAEGDDHLDFSNELATEQMNEGRGFVLEQPKPATSWQRPSTLTLLDHPDVYRIYLDQCRFALRAHKGPFKGMLVRKPTCLATNIDGLADYLEKKCLKNHKHGMLLGGSAKEAAVYTPQLVQALMNGIKAALGLQVAKATSAPHPQGHQWLQWGRALGQIIRDQAEETVSIDREIEETYGKTTHAWPTEHEAEEDDAEDFDAVQALRKEMKTIEDQPRLKEALEKTETFQRVDDGAFSLEPQLRREVHRVHRNLGHPAREIFARALKASGAREDIIRWTKDHFRCPTCDARVRPSPHRPGHLLRALEFNQVVGLDLCFLEAFGQQNILLNMVCWGTNFQQASLCRNKSAEEIVNVFANEWIKHYGVPTLLILDKGREFDNFHFQQTIGGMGAGLHYTDAESPWQNTRTEKAGGILKQKIMSTIHETVASFEELPLVISETVSSRNRYMDRHGFSPMQRVFGKSLRLPSSLMATDSLDRELVEAAAPDAIRRSWEIREAATKSWLQRQDLGAVRRALKARSRTADLKDLAPGTWVYVFRDSPSYHGWVGPGVLLMADLSDRSAWVSMRGRLWRAAREQLRPATPEEELGAELVVELSKEMLEKLSRKEGHNQIAYQDVTSETFPQDEDLEEARRVLRISEAPHDAPPAESGSAGSTYQPSSVDEDEEMISEEATTAPPLSQNPSRRASVHTNDTEDAPMALPPIKENEVNENDETMEIPSAPVEPTRTTVRVDEGPHGTMHFGPAPTAPRMRSTPYQEVPETPPVGFVPPSRAPRMPYPYDQERPPLPEPPPSRSFYMEVMDFDKDDILLQFQSRSPFIGATWRYNREQQRPALQPMAMSNSTFSANDAEASFCPRDRCMYVGKAKSSFGQVEFRNLPEEEKVKFRKSRLKEVESLIKNKAVRVMSVEESIAFEEQFPEQVINSRFVDRFKPKDVAENQIENYKKRAIDEGHLEAIALEEDQQNPKSRLCVIGWEDPQIMEVERSSPTPLSTSLHCCLQLAASRQWHCRVRDVKTAFLQALPTTRKRKLAIRQPKDESLAGYDPRQLLMLETEVYGLVSGPSWWRRSLIKMLTEDLGFEVNVYDKCILTLPAAPSKEPPPDNVKQLTEGFLVIEVDDICEAGNARHQELMKRMESMLVFGKVDALSSGQGSNYAGWRLRQMEDFSFRSDMDEFIYARLQPITLTRKVLKKDAAKVLLTDHEKSQLRGLIASLNWLSREGRPDVAALVIHAIAEKDLRCVLVADSAFDTSGKEKSQHGWLLGFTNQLLNQGKLAPVSLMQWRSKRLRRKAASSLLCEAISMSAATAALERQDAFMESIRISGFQPRSRQRTEDEKLAALGKSTVIAKESEAFCDPNAVIIMDAKSLFDALNSDQCSGEDDRSALEIAIIKESMSVVGGRARWLPHNLNPSDALTKLDGAHTEPLLRMLQSNHLRIEEEADVLQRGKQSDQRLKT